MVVFYIKAMANKLKTRLTTKLGPRHIKVPYKFSKLEGIPQAGDLEYKVWFAADGKEYLAESDGWTDRVVCEGKEIDADFKVPGLGDVSGVVWELVVDYLTQTGAPTPAIDEWIELMGWRIRKGELVRE